MSAACCATRDFRPSRRLPGATPCHPAATGGKACHPRQQARGRAGHRPAARPQPASTATCRRAQSPEARESPGARAPRARVVRAQMRRNGKWWWRRLPSNTRGRAVACAGECRLRGHEPIGRRSGGGPERAWQGAGGHSIQEHAHACDWMPGAPATPSGALGVVRGRRSMDSHPLKACGRRNRATGGAARCPSLPRAPTRCRRERASHPAAGRQPCV